MLKSYFIPLCFLCWSTALQGQPAEALLTQKAKASLSEFHEFLSLPNDAHFPEQMELNIDWASAAFAKRGFDLLRLPTAVWTWYSPRKLFPVPKKQYSSTYRPMANQSILVSGIRKVLIPLHSSKKPQLVNGTPALVTARRGNQPRLAHLCAQYRRL